MANYPLITGNTNTALNAITTGAVGIQKISLTNTVTGKLDQYVILTIKSLGDDGTTVNITKISTVDENDVDSDSLLSETGNGFVKQKNSAYQSRLFTISPLEKTNATTWVQEAPFIGTVKSDYSVENRHTKSWATGSGDHAVPSATAVEASAASSYCIITSAGEALELNATNTYAAAIAAGHSIVPLHNHQYVLDNNIPKGQYVNLLIRASATTGFDTNITHKLLINHNANVLYADTSQNFEISLNASSVNIFQLVAEFNSNSITQGADLGARYSTMNFIPTNEITGNSWRYDKFALTAMDLAPDEFTLPLALDGDSSTTTAQLQNSAQLILSWQVDAEKLNTLAGLSQMFVTTIRAFDNSFVKQPFQIKQSGSMLEEIAYNDNRQGAGVEFIRTIKFPNTLYTTTGEIKAGGVTYVSSPSSNGVYTNFTLSDIKFEQTESIEVKIDDDKEQDIDYIFSTGVYSLFTYHNSYAAKNETVDNYNVTPSSSTPASLIPHVSDANIKFKGTNNKLTGVAQHPMYTWAYSNYSKGLTEHNVTINTLETQDLINYNGLSTSSLVTNEQLYCTSANVDVSVKVAASESGLAPRTDAAAASTVVPSVANPNKYYTVYADTEMPSQPTSASLTRSTSGVYLGRNTEGHLEVDIEFKAPKTSWQPGGSFYGTNRVPWFHLFNEYKLKTAYTTVRPLINFTYDEDKCGVHEITRLEFYGLPALKTATTTNILDGIVDFGTQSFTETSRVVLINADSDSLTHRVAADVDKVSYVQGMEVKGLDGYFPGRNFIGEIIAHASNATIIKLVQEGADGQAGTTPSVSTAATDNQGITVEICKPTQKVNFTRGNYPYTTLGNFKERARVQKTYGSDLSYYNPDINPIDLKIEDRIVNKQLPSAQVSSLWLGMFTETSLAVNQEAVVTANSVGPFDQDSTVVNYSPKEKSISYNTAEIPSERYYSQDYNTDVYLGDAMAMYYNTILLPVEGTYSHTMDFFLTNLGVEDVIFNSAKLVDPVYLPEGAYQLKPHNSTAPTWSLEHNVTVEASVLSNTNTPINTETKEVFNINLRPDTIARSTSVHRRMRKYAGEVKERIKLNEFKISGNNDNKLSVNFSVASNSNVAGDYYKCLEVHYVRDIGVNQLYGSTLRTYGQQGIWVMRKLIKISITTENKISVTDVDDSGIGFNSDIDFTVQV